MRTTFTIYGTPVAKARARTVFRGGKVRSFTPKKTVDWENSIRGQSLKYKPKTPSTGEISIEIIAYRQLLKSFSKKKRSQAIEGILRPSTKPDLDNIFKSVTDALEGLYYVNDSQIVDIKASKFYSENPGIVIMIESKEE